MSTLPMNRDGYGAPVMQNIDRQRKLAEQLRNESSQQLQGQMVSNHYVAPSWTQYLAQGLKGYESAKLEKDANTSEKDYNATKARRLAEFLKDNQARTTQQGTTDTSVMPAYEPSQQDRFGSPLQGVQRQPVVTSTPNMVTETPDQVQQRQRMQAYQLAGEYQNDPTVALAIADMNHARDRGEIVGDRQDERTYQDGREEKLYNRNRTDKLSDTEAERKYQDIVMKEQQGFQTTMQDKQFAQQFKMQAQSQNFQAGMQSNSQKFQAGQNALSRQQALTLEQQKLAATKAKPLTEVQGKAALYGNRANDAHNILNSLDGKYSPMGINAQSTASETPLIGGVLGAATNAVMSPSSQKAQQAQRNFLTAVLRQESGAAISPSEFDTAKKQYFPQTGDSAEVIAQKKANREEAIKGFSTMSAGAFTPQYDAPQSAQSAVLSNDAGYLAWKKANGK